MRLPPADLSYLLERFNDLASELDEGAVASQRGELQVGAPLLRRRHQGPLAAELEVDLARLEEALAGFRTELAGSGGAP